jgi:hypothetical protein
MATVAQIWGTFTALTCTLASLASSTVGVGRRSTAYDNSTSGYEDFEIEVVITTASSGTAATGYATVYVYSSSDGTNYETGGATDAGYTVIDLPALPGSMALNANSTTYRRVWRLSSLGWATMPPKFGVVVVNSSGATLPATTHSVSVRGVTRTVT